MAILYVRSTDGSDASDGSTWADAKATLAGAFTAASAGDTIYVSDAHAETQASAMTLTSPGTAASPVRVICADDAAEPPTARATTGTISTTGASNHLNFGTGHVFYYGLTFSAGDGANSAYILLQSGGTTSRVWFDSCTLKLNHTNATGAIGTPTGNSTQWPRFVNTKFHFGNAGQFILIRGPFEWRDTPDAIQGTMPSTLLNPSIGYSGTSHIHGVDLSAKTSGSLVNLGDTNGGPTHMLLENCKLGSGVAFTTGTPNGSGGVSATFINCDSADTNYRYHHQNYQGTITQETTVVKTGGATDGTTPVARKMVSTANSKVYSPLVDLPIVVWCDSLTEQTVTIDVVTDNVTLTDAEAWIDVEYLGTSGSPISLTESDRIEDDVFGTPANQTADTDSTWTTTGLTTPVKQELSVTFTPAEKGPFRVRVNLAKASTTMYYDPLVLTDSGRQYMIGASGFINEGVADASGGGGGTSTMGLSI